MILRVNIDMGLKQRNSRRLTEAIKFFDADDWAHALAKVSVWVATLQPPPITIHIDDRTDLVRTAVRS